MRMLIAEDDFTSRRILQIILEPYGHVDIAVDGEEVLEAFQMALDKGVPYDLICLDIMMPKMDGREALKKIREIEEKHYIIGKKEKSKNNVKIIITTALDDPKSIIGSFDDQCEAYIVKPVYKADLIDKIKELNLI
jgi:two-component system chemotaxis response regulator CheY